MLKVTETAMPGIGLSIPQVVARREEPFLAIRAAGVMPELPQFAPPKFEELHDYMRRQHIEGRLGFFRYRRFGPGGGVELEVGTTTDRLQAGDGEIIAGRLPEGRYAFATYRGPYDRLHDAFLMLEGWMKGRGLRCEGEGDGGDWRPACQVEIYRISPAQTASSLEWETDLLLKLAD